MSFFVLAMIALAAFGFVIAIGFVLLVFEDYVFAIAMSFFAVVISVLINNPLRRFYKKEKENKE